MRTRAAFASRRNYWECANKTLNILLIFKINCLCSRSTENGRNGVTMFVLDIENNQRSKFIGFP